MTLSEIKTAVKAGRKVCWSNPSHEVFCIGSHWVIKNIHCSYCWALTDVCGRLQESENLFYLGD